MPLHIAVSGPGDSASAEDLAAAREVGRSVARAGAVLLCGGLGGVMAAAAAGCAEAGGTSVGLLPGDDRSAAAEGLTVVLPTGLGELRNALLVRCCDALVAVGGSWGTLSEVALARRTGVPVVVLGGWSVRTPAGEEPLGEVADDPVDAVRRALARAAR